MTRYNVPGIEETRPSMFLAAAKNLEDFAADRCVERKMILAPTQDWQAERIGASTPPIDLGEGRWLLNYHGKQDEEEGFERPSRFQIPCVFFTGIVGHKGDLLVSYGAADEHVGLLKIDYQELMKIMEDC